MGRLLDLRATADYEIGATVVTPEAVEQHLEDVERLLARCSEIVDEAAARGPDEPDPPPDR